MHIGKKFEENTMIKKNFVLGIVVALIFFLQVLTLIKMNEIRETVAQLSAKTAVKETTSEIEGQTPPVYSEMTNVIKKNPYSGQTDKR